MRHQCRHDIDLDDFAIRIFNPPRIALASLSICPVTSYQ